MEWLRVFFAEGEKTSHSDKCPNMIITAIENGL